MALPAVEIEPTSKGEAQFSEERFWYYKIDVFVALSRAGWVPTWQEGEGQGQGNKRVRVE